MWVLHTHKVLLDLPTQLEHPSHSTLLDLHFHRHPILLDRSQTLLRHHTMQLLATLPSEGLTRNVPKIMIKCKTD